MEVSIRACAIEDLDDLQRIGYETYDETFRPVNADETMDAYLQEAFNRERMLSELNNENSWFYFLYLDDELAGYLKINDAPAQTDLNDPESMEIERVYVKKAFKGRGLGKQLLDFGIQIAKEKKKKYVWLGVWEKNTNAIAFYTKIGFFKAGQHKYRMGEELQNDFIMKKMLSNHDTQVDVNSIT